MWNVFREWFHGWWNRMKYLRDPSRIPVPVFSQLDQSHKRIQLDNGHVATIRMANHQDIDAIYQVEYEAYNGNPPWSRYPFVVDIKQSVDAVYFLLEYRQEVVAFIGSRFSDNKDVHITNVAVIPECRYLGCGKKLIERLEEAARQYGQEQLSLEVRKSNAKAIKLYHKMGFSQTGYKKDYYTPDFEDAIEMTKKLLPQTPSSFLTAEYSFSRLTANEPLPILQQIYRLVQQNYHYASNWTQEGFQEDLQAETSRYYGIFCQKELIGFAGFQTVLDEATLTNIVVSRDFQRQGLAKRLWSMAWYDLKSQGVKSIFLEVRESNHRARAFYEEIGFKEYYQRRDYYHQPLEDAFLYRYDHEEVAHQTGQGA